MNKPSYLIRLRQVALGLLLSWPDTVPGAVCAVLRCATRALIEFTLTVVSLVGLAACICLPFAFWLAPLFMWIVARQEARAMRRQEAAKRLADAMERAFGGHDVH